MRPIKLKLWDKKNKKWYTDIWFFGFDGHLYGLKNRTLITLNDDDYEMVMFTGLHDKNGDEIYEGDIVKEHGFKNKVVVWNESLARFSLKIDNGGTCGITYNMEVIGNIYENQEPLKEQ